MCSGVQCYTIIERKRRSSGMRAILSTVLEQTPRPRSQARGDDDHFDGVLMGRGRSLVHDLRCNLIDAQVPWKCIRDRGHDVSHVRGVDTFRLRFLRISAELSGALACDRSETACPQLKDTKATVIVPAKVTGIFSSVETRVVTTVQIAVS